MLMNYNYVIADTKIQINTERELMENWQAELFHKEYTGEADVCVNLKLSEEIPVYEGRLVTTTNETHLYINDQELIQETFDRKDGTPLIVSRYPANKSGDLSVWGNSKYVPHVVRSWVLWSAIDLPYLLLMRNLITVHSASVETDGGVILFIAPSGTGKSTQARLWDYYRGAKQLNGDKNIIGMKENCAYVYGTPFSGTSEICADFALPLKAIVLLSQAPVNTVKRLHGIQAIMAIMNNCFGHASVPGCTDRMLGILGEVLKTVGVYALACTPDEKAVIALENELNKER